jgi:hypothetical protein
MPDSSITVEDNVSVIIKPVSGVMSAGNAEHFRNTSMAFLSDLLNQLEQPIYDVVVSVTGGNILTRRRRLQEDSMQVDMVVSGKFDPVPGLAETEEDLSIGYVARQFFTVQGDSFVKMLKETDNDDDATYFEPVTSVESVAVPGDDVTPAESPAPPGPAPATGSDGPGLSIGGIVGIALVGALVVALGAAFFVNNMRKRRRNNPRSRSTKEKKSSTKKTNKSSAKARASKQNSDSSSPQKLSRPNSASSPSSPEKAMDAPPVRAIGGPPSEKGSIKRVDSDVQSDLQWGAESLIGAESNMSYAYSLEDGIQLSPSGESQGSAVDSELFNYGNDNSPIPKEISKASEDGLGTSKNRDDDDLDVEKSWSPNSSSIIREITAPPGKLGVVLNTSTKGPVVQSVAPGSPLEGMVWPGDVITSIDGIKTKKMSAASMMEYMQKNLFKSRKLTVISDPDA